MTEGLIPPNDWFQDLVVRTLVDLGGQAERQTIYRRARELANFTEAQRAVPPPPGNNATLPDRIEFELSFALSKLKAAGRLEHPSRGVWRLPPNS
jgi:restriction endonuclease Mrr